MKLRNTSNRK